MKSTTPLLIFALFLGATTVFAKDWGDDPCGGAWGPCPPSDWTGSEYGKRLARRDLTVLDIPLRMARSIFTDAPVKANKARRERRKARKALAKSAYGMDVGPRIPTKQMTDDIIDMIQTAVVIPVEEKIRINDQVKEAVEMIKKILAEHEPESAISEFDMPGPVMPTDEMTENIMEMIEAKGAIQSEIKHKKIMAMIAETVKDVQELIATFPEAEHEDQQPWAEKE